MHPFVRQLASSVDHRIRHLPPHLQILSGRLRLARRRRGASFYVFGAIDDRFQTPTARRTRFSAPASPQQPLHARQHPENLECDEDPRNSVHRSAYCKQQDRINRQHPDPISSGAQRLHHHLRHPQEPPDEKIFREIRRPEVGGTARQSASPQLLQEYARRACAAQAGPEV